MQNDHRRPLVAFFLVSLSCVFVLAQSVNRGPSVGPGPSISAFADSSVTPSEEAEQFFRLPVIVEAPPDEVEEPEIAPSTLGANVDALGDFLPVNDPDDPVGDVSGGSVTDTSDGGGSQDEAAPLSADPVGSGGGSPAAGGGSAGPGDPDPDLGDGGSVGAFTASGDGPITSPGDGGPDGAPDGDNGGPGGSGKGGPAPHSSDHVSSGGQVGPPPGNGPSGHQNQGPKNHGPKDKGSKKHGPKDRSKKHGPKGKGSKEHGPKDRSKKHGPKGKGSKKHGPKGKGPKGKGPKGKG